MPVPRLVFVLSPYQNAFFFELADALAGALGELDVDSVVSTEPGDHAVRDDDVFVLLPPHEYSTLEGRAFVDDAAVAARTIGLSAEQPHQAFFAHNASVAAGLGAVVDFSSLAVEAYQRLGVPARHLRFGYVPAWDEHDRRRRPADGPPVLYFGNKAPRRLSMLAAAADPLVAARAHLFVSDNSEPNREDGPTFLTGHSKRRLLASAGLLVNIHQGDEPYFEWLRFVEAAHSATPVLTERSSGSAPFAAGHDFLDFEDGDLASAIDRAVADPVRLEEVGAAAHETLRRLPLSESVPVLVETAQQLLAAPPPEALPARTRAHPIGRDRTDPVPARGSRATSGLRRRLRSALARGGIGGYEVVAPTGTTLVEDVAALVAEPRPARFVNVMAAGRDDAGLETLEGIWPWQPWRLLHGQHLGRVLLVEPDLLADVRAWMREPLFDPHPHLAVQLYACVHGIAGGHIARPSARVAGVALDPTHDVPESVASRCRDIIEQTVAASP